MQLEENFRELMGKGEVKIIKIIFNEESRKAGQHCLLSEEIRRKINESEQGRQKIKTIVNEGKMKITNLFPLSNGIIKRNKKNIIVTLGEFHIP